MRGITGIKSKVRKRFEAPTGKRRKGKGKDGCVNDSEAAIWNHAPYLARSISQPRPLLLRGVCLSPTISFLPHLHAHTSTHTHTVCLHSPHRVLFLPSGFWQRDQLLWLRLGNVDRKQCRNFGLPALQALQKQCPSLFKNHWSVENPGDQTKESLAPHAVFGREWLIHHARSDMSYACSI